MTTTFIYRSIDKMEKQPDGTLMVEGIATDDTLDSDQQVCDPEWLKSAMPDWFKWGNIREQHSNIAAGVATGHEVVGNQHRIRAHVVDPGSVAKVLAGVLKGFSIGIRNARVTKDKAASGGRITDGEIVEVSLVDRPANPSCTLALAKAVNGVVIQTEDLTLKWGSDYSEEHDDPDEQAEDDDPDEEGDDSEMTDEELAAKAAKKAEPKKVAAKKPAAKPKPMRSPRMKPAASPSGRAAASQTFWRRSGRT